MTLTVAYLVNQYPKTSHTFIRREILAVERQGVGVHRVAVRGWRDNPINDVDRQEQQKTWYILQGGLLPLIVAGLRALAERPRAFARAARLAVKAGLAGDRPIPVHLVYLLEACCAFYWLRARGVQHVHAHFGTNPAELALLIKALGGPPFGFTAHGPEEFDKPEAIRLGDKVRAASYVVAISSYGRSQILRRLHPSHWNRVHVVRCGLDPDYFVKQTPCAGSNLVCVGRLTEQKGQSILLDAARKLRKEGVGFTLVLVGDGELRADLELQIAKHRLQEHVTITGWLNEAQVSEEIRIARALVLPSFAEGLPVVIMEAMALGRPVVSTFVAGIPELVLPGETGWLVPAGDVDALAEAMRRCLAASLDQLVSMGNAGFSQVEALHHVDVEGTKLISLFMSATGQRADLLAGRER